MSNKYTLKGNEISVFPFGSERSIDPNARVLNEQNITKIIKSITDNSSYVIKYDETNDVIEFVLNGYYFVVSISSLLGSLKNPKNSIYAYIKMAESNETYKYLTGGDVLKSSYTGQGTSSYPYILSEGSYSFTLSKETSELYFNYTFLENGSIVFKTLQNIEVYERYVAQNGEAQYKKVEDNKITGSENSTVVFKLTLNEDAVRGTSFFDVLFTTAEFTAVKFTDDIASIGDEATHNLHIFDAEYSDNDGDGDGVWVVIIPESSKRKFTAPSIDVVNINCGTASDYLTENTQ